MTGTAVCLGLLVPATVATVGPAVLAALGRASPRRRTRQIPQALPSVVVLVPAHDEEAMLPNLLRSVAAQDYPPGRVSVVVVADHCTDATAAVALEYGATVVTRTDAGRRGKGHALAAGVDALCGVSFDALLVVDADCTLNETALRELMPRLETGADVVQARVESRNADDGPAAFVAAVGARVDAGVAAGRERLGLSARLRGTGMMFRRTAVERIRWATDSPVEDAAYERQLRRAGGRVAYCDAATVTATAPARLHEFCRQRRRWAAAGPGGSKPLAVALAALALAACLGTAQFVGWAVAVAMIVAGHYLAAAKAVGLTRRRLGLLSAAPAVVARLAVVALAGWLAPDRGWAVREARPA